MESAHIAGKRLLGRFELGFFRKCGQIQRYALAYVSAISPLSGLCYGSGGGGRSVDAPFTFMWAGVQLGVGFSFVASYFKPSRWKCDSSPFFRFVQDGGLLLAIIPA